MLHTHIQTDRHTDRHTDIQTYIQTYRHRYIQTYNIQTYKHTDIHTDIQSYIQTYRHTDIHTYIHAYTHTHIHTYTHTHIHTYTHTSFHCIALHCIRLHYITLHICIHTYMYTCYSTTVKMWFKLLNNCTDVTQRTINSDQWWLMWNIVSNCTLPQNFPFLVHSNLFKEPQNEIPTKLQNDCVIFVVKDCSFSSAHLEDFWLGLWPP